MLPRAVADAVLPYTTLFRSRRRGICRGQRGMDDDRATLGPANRLFRRWVSSSWLPRRKHAECGYRAQRSERVGGDAGTTGTNRRRMAPALTDKGGTLRYAWL